MSAAGLAGTCIFVFLRKPVKMNVLAYKQMEEGGEGEKEKDFKEFMEEERAS